MYNFMEENILKEIILDQNEFKQDIIQRDFLERVEEKRKSDFIVIISGVRRCGKSTLLNEFRKNQKYNKYYLNFDDERLNDFNVKDFDKLYKVFTELYGDEKTFYFDEIQNIFGFEKFLRRLYEKNKIYITGSNSNLLSKELGTHLTGRYVQIELFPFSFSEFLKFKKFKIEKNDFYKRVKMTIVKNLFREYLKSGGFYQFLNTKDKDFFKYLYDSILYKDVIVRYKLQNEKNIKDVLYYLISNVGKEFSYNSLKNITNILNSTTIKEYINYLEEVYLIFTINKFDYSLKKQLVNPKKVYSIDNGLSNSISFKFSEDFGRQLENIVFLHYKRKSIYEIFYHKKKYECDFLLKEKDKIVKAVQVTKTLNYENEKREVMGLVEAVKEYGLKEGLILTYEDDEREFVRERVKIKVRQIWKYLLEN